MSAPLAGAFADPVHDSQRCFRAVLDAMAHPGRIVTVPAVIPPGGIGAAAGAVLLTLIDHETPLWLDPLASGARDWIAFHTGAPEVTDPSAAAFALAIAPPDLTRFPLGTHDEPQCSVTVIWCVGALGSGASFRLVGPGLREPAQVRIAGLPADFPTTWARNHALFPRGADLILCAGDKVMALPRTVAIREN